ncbi:MAG: HEAT repeat domain-containing protein [Deltaproteobacteria bacterium]|nr:HEAT repeat domain-containing protein [Deltaproteobacteria bacterium]
MRSILSFLFLSLFILPLHASEIPLDPCESFLSKPSGGIFSNEVLYQNVRDYCRLNLKDLLSAAWKDRRRVKVVSIDEALRILNSVLTPQRDTATEAQDGKIMMLQQIILKLQTGIPEVESLPQDLESLYPPLESLYPWVPSYLSHLKDMIRWVDAYLASFHFRTLPGLEKDFYLAQIQFGSAEYQIFALSKLIEYYRVNHALFTRDMLRKVISHPNPLFRHHAVTLFKKEGVFPSQVASSIDETLQKSFGFSAEEQEFRELIEVLVNLLSDTHALKLAEWMNTPRPLARPLERRGAIRTLGELGSIYALEALIHGYSTAGGEDLSLLNLFVAEIAHCVQTHPERKDTASHVFLAMAQTGDINYQRSGIFGLGELLQKSQGPHPKEIQFLRERLKKTTEEEVQTEIILALTKLGFDYYIANEIRPYLSRHSNAGVAAALYLAQVTDQKAIQTLVMALTFPENSQRFKISLALRIEGLEFLAKKNHPEAHTQLLALWDRSSRSQRRRIMVTLFSHCKNTEILSQLAQKLFLKNN